MEQSLLDTHCSTVSLTSFRTGAVPDRQSPGWFPTSPGITGLRLSLPAGRCALTGRSRSANIAQTGSHRHPRDTRLLPTSACRILPNRSLSLSLHIHSQSNMCGLSPDCCYKRPGFHRTAVLGVRAFTVLLFYSYSNYTQTGVPMDLPNYPSNKIPQHLYIDSNNTLYSLNKSSICLSQDRSSNN